MPANPPTSKPPTQIQWSGRNEPEHPAGRKPPCEPSYNKKRGKRRRRRGASRQQERPVAAPRCPIDSGPSGPGRKLGPAIAVPVTRPGPCPSATHGRKRRYRNAEARRLREAAAAKRQLRPPSRRSGCSEQRSLIGPRKTSAVPRKKSQRADVPSGGPEAVQAEPRLPAKTPPTRTQKKTEESESLAPACLN